MLARQLGHRLRRVLGDDRSRRRLTFDRLSKGLVDGAASLDFDPFVRRRRIDCGCVRVIKEKNADQHQEGRRKTKRSSHGTPIVGSVSSSTVILYIRFYEVNDPMHDPCALCLSALSDHRYDASSVHSSREPGSEAVMDLDAKICYCFHVTHRKLDNYIRICRPKV